MMIDPASHLFLHRLRQHEHDRHHRHLAALSATPNITSVDPAATSETSTPWQRRLLRASRRRHARGPTTRTHIEGATPTPAISTTPPGEASPPQPVTDVCPDRPVAEAATS